VWTSQESVGRGGGGGTVSLHSPLCITAGRPIQSVLMYSGPSVRGQRSGRTTNVELAAPCCSAARCTVMLLLTAASRISFQIRRTGKSYGDLQTMPPTVTAFTYRYNEDVPSNSCWGVRQNTVCYYGFVGSSCSRILFPFRQILCSRLRFWAVCTTALCSYCGRHVHALRPPPPTRRKK
jgi:hypothetical protein